MNGYINRIFYTHRGSRDFGPVGSSFGKDRQDWATRLVYRARVRFQAQRPHSTVYWTDGDTAVVIRRIPGHQGDGRDDCAFALLGKVDQLGVHQALALAGDSPVWTEHGWYDGPKIDPITTSELPVPLPSWSTEDASTVLASELWPLVHAFDQRPDVPILVATDLAEPAMVGLVRSLIGMGRVMRPGARLWSFSTREDQPAQGDIQPRIQFLPHWSGADGVSNASRTVVRYSHIDTASADTMRYEHLVQVYLDNGSEALHEELRPAPVGVGKELTQDRLMAQGPATQREQQAYPGQPDNPSLHQPPIGGPNHAPPSSQPPAEQTAWQLFQSLPKNAREAIPGLVEAIVRAPVTDADRGKIRQQLADPESQFRQRIRTTFSPPDQDRILAPLLVMTMRGTDWESREVTRSMEGLLRAIGGSPRHGRRRSTLEITGLGPSLSMHVIWLLVLAVVLLTFVLIYA